MSYFDTYKIFLHFVIKLLVRFWGTHTPDVQKRVQSKRTEPKAQPWGNPKLYEDTARGEVRLKFNSTN